MKDKILMVKESVDKYNLVLGNPTSHRGLVLLSPSTYSIEKYPYPKAFENQRMG